MSLVDLLHFWILQLICVRVFWLFSLLFSKFILLKYHLHILTASLSFCFKFFWKRTSLISQNTFNKSYFWHILRYKSNTSVSLHREYSDLFASVCSCIIENYENFIYINVYFLSLNLWRFFKNFTNNDEFTIPFVFIVNTFPVDKIAVIKEVELLNHIYVSPETSPLFIHEYNNFAILKKMIHLLSLRSLIKESHGEIWMVDSDFSI